MSVFAHIDALNEKHQMLTQEINEAYKHHEPDQRIAELKKKRLHLEEEIERFYGVAASSQAIAHKEAQHHHAA